MRGASSPSGASLIGPVFSVVIEKRTRATGTTKE